MPPSQGAAPDVPSHAVNEDRLVQLKIRTERMEHVSRRIGMLLKVPLALLGLALFFWLVAIIWSAWGGRGILIDGFRVPPSAASSGLDGEAVASRIRNHVIAMQAATASSRLAGVQPVNRVEDNQIEIPQTGLTLGEINGAIRRWLGRDMRVSGDIAREGNAFAITLRIDNSVQRIPERGFERDLDGLVRTAAEKVFQASNRYRYAVYLWSVGRPRESTAEFIALARSRVDNSERAWALNGLAANILDDGRCSEAIPILHFAARLGPSIPNIHGNLRNAHVCLGHDQQAADATAEELRLLRGAAGLLDPAGIDWLLLQDQDNLAGQSGDYRRRLQIYEQMESRGEGDFSLERAQALAENHEIRASIRTLSQWLAVARWDPQEIAAQRARYLHVRFTQAAALGSWEEAASLAGQSGRLVSRSPSLFVRAQLRTENRPLEAMALARAGLANRASEIVSDLPADCYLCARSRAVVASARGDQVEANRWFETAVALGPRLPFAYRDWGETLLRRGDAVGALDRFDRALVHGPEYADAHKGRGDALYALGRYGEAERSYRAAAVRAPRWGALHMAWAQSLWRLRERDEARARLDAAARMDLNRSDFARLGRMRAAARAP